MAQDQEALIRVGVVFGGMSSEREPSLASGRNVCRQLDPQKYAVIPVFMDPEARLWELPEKLLVQNTTTDIASRVEKEAKRLRYEELRERVDVVFVALHGKYGEDGCLQGVLELLRIPYTNSGVLASSLGLNKPMQQRLLAAAGIKVPKGITISMKRWKEDPKEALDELTEAIGFPCAIKPSREGSSIGVSIVREAAGVGQALEKAFQWDNVALVEEMLEGMEFSCIVLGNEEPQAFPPTEIVKVHEYFTYEDKYMPGATEEITPARLSDHLLAKVMEEAEKAHRVLGFLGCSRIDGFVRGEEVLITDCHSTCGMAPSAFLFQQAAEVGLTPRMLLGKIIDYALEAHRKKIGPL